MSPGSASLPRPPLPVRLNGGIPPRPAPLLGHLPRLEPLLLRRLEHLRVPRLQGGAGAVGGAVGGQRAEGTIGGKGGKRSARFYGHTEKVRKSVACIYNLQACPYFLFFFKCLSINHFHFHLQDRPPTHEVPPPSNRRQRRRQLPPLRVPLLGGQEEDAAGYRGRQGRQGDGSARIHRDDSTGVAAQKEERG